MLETVDQWLGWSLEAVSFAEATLRVAAAGALGGLVGLDREMKNKPVGIRAYMLVAIGAAIFSLISVELSHFAKQHPDFGAADMSRIIQGLVGALGFLGAGAIIQAQDKVVGTATAASIWVVGAIGMGLGFGFYGYALLAAVSAVVVLTCIGYLRARIRPDVEGEFITEEKELDEEGRAAAKDG